jgi:hypothetical protein
MWQQTILILWVKLRADQDLVGVVQILIGKQLTDLRATRCEVLYMALLTELECGPWYPPLTKN